MTAEIDKRPSKLLYSFSQKIKIRGGEHAWSLLSRYRMQAVRGWMLRCVLMLRNSVRELEALSFLREEGNLKQKSPIAQDIQPILVNHPSISLAWVEDQVGIQGTEAADNLAKRASTEGTQLHVPTPIVAS
ncbi:hypothetical protein AVEN_89117-1 [Araneus ventricosus]|uniref:Uncharacterized protein n=1 Tax=Araneus ventricosus TaxID=182803 RepID=A0A4Y2B144_ARAVE|nr:hypothetical protein AVEN_89117-1 [Araneus ventricosus]